MDSSIYESTCKNDVLRSVTEEYLTTVNIGQMSPAKIEADLLERELMAFELHNLTVDKGQKWRCPDSLTPLQIAMCINKKHIVRLINLGSRSNSREFMPLGIYVDIKDDDRYGTYVLDRTYLSRIIRGFNYTILSSEIEEVFRALRDIVEVVNRTTDRDLIPTKNKIFDYKSKEDFDYSPEYVFIAKLPVNYNGQVALKTFTNDDGTLWNIEDWVKSLSDNPEVVTSIWEMLSAVVRPNVRWNMAAWLYGTGNNGKGCLTQLCRSLVGFGNCASIPLASMSKDFVLEPLIRSIAVVVDENDDDYIDNSANLKTIITGDILDINIKFKSPIQLQPRVFMVQCMNSMPRSSSKADGFYRRQLFIPLDKCFDKCENKRIKQEYLLDEEVLEYVLWKVLNTDFYEFTETSVSKEMKEEYKLFNDPVRQFVEEVIPYCTWNFLPSAFLYDLYKSWFAENNPSGKVTGKVTFTNDLKGVLKEVGGFEEYGRTHPIHWEQTDCYKPEPLIVTYDLKNWMNPTYRGNDIDRLCMTNPRSSMCGFKKVLADAEGS